MKYKFVYVSLERCPSIKEWKLLIDPEDQIIGIVPKIGSVLEEVLDNSIKSYSMAYFSDPHINLEQILKRGSEGTSLFFSIISHPLILDGQKRENICRKLAEGKSILIARNGSYSFLEGYIILDTFYSDLLVYPKENDSKEKIIISRYPGCKHYYLSSNLRGRIFSNNQFYDKSEAFKEACKYVTKNCITIKEDSFAYLTTGD